MWESKTPKTFTLLVMRSLHDRFLHVFLSRSTTEEEISLAEQRASHLQSSITGKGHSSVCVHIVLSSLLVCPGRFVRQVRMSEILSRGSKHGLISDSLTLDHPTDQPDRPTLGPPGHYSEGTSQVLSLSDGWERKRPEWLLFLLYQLCENMEDRLEEAPILDLFLAEKAHSNGKEMHAIETVQEVRVPHSPTILSSSCFQQCNPISSVSRDEVSLLQY